MTVQTENVFSSILDSLPQVTDYSSILQLTAEALGVALGAKRVLVIPNNSALKTPLRAVEWAAENIETHDDDFLLSIGTQLVGLTRHSESVLRVEDALESAIFRGQSRELDATHISSILAISVRHQDLPVATICLFRSAFEQAWSEHEARELELRLQELTPALMRITQPTRRTELPRVASDNITPFPKKPKGSQTLPAATAALEDRFQTYRRLVENSEAILFSCDKEFVLQFMSRRALDFLGSLPEDILQKKPVRWFELIHPDNREAVRDKALEITKSPKSFEEEFPVVNHVTGRVRWLLTRLVPVIDEQGEHIGWDGFGMDITARREAQSALDLQSRKVRALYTVSSAIRGYLDPSNIAARGLAALCTATGADAGVCYLFSGAQNRSLQLVAHQGFTAGFLQSRDVEQSLSQLIGSVAGQNESIVVADMRVDSRMQKFLSEGEGIVSAVLVPISAEDEVFGALALFHRQAGRFDGGDVLLVSAAANQIGLAARQAHLFSAYRRQTKNLSALYRMSHELSQYLTLEEVFRQSFTIIRDELGLKRLWLGLLDETGNRIVGQAAYGPGWRRRLVEINVDILSTDNPIRRILQSRQVAVIDDPNEMFGALGLKRFVSRFAIHAIAVAPLIARGQVLGVLAVQPGSAEQRFEDDELALLSSLANEIAALILTKRLEEQISEGDKMRSAGLLAAGIAHNFNNLLQAVLGQASLLEMQKNNEALVLKASRIIGESANKGAALVKQLLSFANLEEPRFMQTQVEELIQREMRSLERLLRSNQKILIHTRQSLPPIQVDPNHVIRILSALISNAAEAMKERGGNIDVFLDALQGDSEGGTIELPEGRYIRIGVRDSGVGMDTETKRRCFEPFFTTKDLDPSSGLGLSGAGLGLAAAYALARRNGGMLTVESKLGTGSLFTLYLPVEQPVRKAHASKQTGGITPPVSSQLRVERVTEGKPLTRPTARLESSEQTGKPGKRTPE